MDSRLQAYLDGDLPLERLPAQLRTKAEAWDGLLEEVRAGTPAGAPLGLDTRVLAALDSDRRPSSPRWKRRRGRWAPT